VVCWSPCGMAIVADFFTFSTPSAILSIISDKCRRRYAWEITHDELISRLA
jgi:hypothetical protein